MNLPNYFLADLPPEAHLSSQMLVEACQTLKRNREQYLRERPTESLIRLIAGVAEDWLADDYPFRQLALRQGPAETGFDAVTLNLHGDVLTGTTRVLARCPRRGNARRCRMRDMRSGRNLARP